MAGVMIEAFVYGAILAFGLIIPLGVQNIFVFNQGATQKKFCHALPSVIAAAICDMTLVILAVLGVSIIVLSIAWLKTVIFVVGFFFLLYMGWTVWNSNPAKADANSKPLSAKKQFSFAISVSLLNPHALIDTIGVIGTNSLNFIGNAKLAYTIACILISTLWFFGLAFAGHVLQKLDNSNRWLTLINKFSALVIWTVATYIGWQLIN